jgi:uncharacterized protein (TIGR03118 family)
MPQNQPISRFAIAMGMLALAFTATFVRADSLGFTQTNLVSDVPNLAANTDPNLKNPWGVSFSGTSPFWTSDQGTGLSTLYSATGVPQGLVVTIPGSAAPPTGPTGQVFNTASGFLINGNAKATFIFDNLNGSISAWNPGAGTTAVVQASSTTGAIYTGLAQNTSTNFGSVLYAANSAPGGGIDVYNSSWMRVSLGGSAFIDPNAITGFVPFNVQSIGADLFVTYASLGPGGVPMPGGYVDEFDADGNFIKRIATGGDLFAPWGITLAPANFGPFSNDLLIGNFGNGEILAYDATSDMFLDTLDGANGQPLINDHLWALETRSAPGFDPNAIYFSAGINDEADGLFGQIDANTPEPATIFGTATGLIALAFAQVRRRLFRSSL